MEENKIQGWIIKETYHDDGADSAADNSISGFFLIYENGGIEFLHTVGLYGGWFKKDISEIEKEIRKNYPQLEWQDLSDMQKQNLRNFCKFAQMEKERKYGCI
jgi:hypothetical protein